MYAIRSYYAEARLGELIAQDSALEGEANAIKSVDRLVHYYRNLHILLSNFVSLPVIRDNR